MKHRIGGTTALVALAFMSCIGSPVEPVSETSLALDPLTNVHEESIAPDADTDITDWGASGIDTNSDAASWVRVGAGTHTLIRFDSDELHERLDGRPLVRASLRLVLASWDYGGTHLRIHRMNRPWTASHRVTYACEDERNPGDGLVDCEIDWSMDAVDAAQRPYTAEPTHELLVDNNTHPGDIVEFDVTDDIVDALTGGGEPNWIVTAESGPTIWFHSLEATSPAHHPQLVLSIADDDYVPAECPAPALDGSRITRVYDVVEHIFAGDCPVQAAVAHDTIDPRRASHLHGKALGADGLPLPGVTVKLLDRPEFGWTRSRTNGEWDLVVNGGGRMVVQFSKAGYLPVQRPVEVAWGDHLVLDEVVLLQRPDEADCLVVTGATGGFYAGPEESDTRGARRLAIYLPSSPTTTITDGSGATVADYCICSVEYTVDRALEATGQRAMPGDLPPTVAYTYAAELELRQYDAGTASCGATIGSPSFSTPAFAYVKNFLGFPVGSRVPSGYYSKELGAWVPEPDGRVLAVIAAGSGCAFDADGDGLPDSNVDDEVSHDITADELAAFECGPGAPFAVGDQVWRIPLNHFSPLDWNWAVDFIGNALVPFANWANGDANTNNQCTNSGSIIGCEDQTLGEAIPIAGTPWSVHYQSERQRGRRARYQLELPFRGQVLESGDACTTDADCGSGKVCSADRQCAVEPSSVRVEVQVSGRRFVYDGLSFSDGSFTFDEWDGTDAWGRLLQGSQPVTVQMGYFYPATYVDPPAVGGRSFSMPPDGSATVNVPAGQVALWTTWRGLIGGWDQGSIDGHPRGQGLGGWSLTPHHVYDARAGLLYRGDGTTLATAGIQPRIHRFAGGGGGGEGDPAVDASVLAPKGIAAGPDGTLYIAHGGPGGTDGNRIRRVTPDGTLEAFAGTGVAGDADLDVAADVATFRLGASSEESGMFVRRDGSVVVVDARNNCIREVREGRVRRLAGQSRYSPVESCSADNPASLGDGGPAHDALLSCPAGVTEGPSGAIFISDQGNDRVRRVDLGGTITTYAAIEDPSGLAVSPSGDLYVLSNQRQVYRIGPSGTRTRVAGGGAACTGSTADPTGDGGIATDACLVGAHSLALGRDGSLYIAEWSTHRVRRVSPNGLIDTVAGTGEQISTSTPAGDGGPATSARFLGIGDVTVGADSALYIADRNANIVRVVRPGLPDSVVGESIVAEPDGSFVYRFDHWGRHIRTEHGLTGEPLLTIAYHGTTGLVTQVTSLGGGGSLTVVRDPATLLPLRMENAFGHITQLTFESGYLKIVRDPESREHTATYHSGQAGLLDTFTAPDGETWSFTYDGRGRLLADTAPTSTGVEQTLTHHRCGDPGYPCSSNVSHGWGVAHDFAGSGWLPRMHEVWHLGTTRLRRRITDPSGALTESDTGNIPVAPLAAPSGANTEYVPITFRHVMADGSVIHTATGADPRPGLGEYTRAVQMLRVPTGITSTVTTERVIEPTGAPSLADITRMTDAITVNENRTTIVSVEIDRSGGSPTQAITLTSPRGLVTEARTDRLGRVTLVDAPGLLPINIYYDSQTGGVSAIAQGQRRLEAHYREDGVGPAQPWIKLLRKYHLSEGELDRLELQHDDSGWIEALVHNSRTTGVAPDSRGRPGELTLPHGRIHGQTFTALGAMQRYTPPTVTSATSGGVLEVSAFDSAHQAEEIRVLDGAGAVAETVGYVYDPDHGHLARIDLPGGRSLEITRDTTTTPNTVVADGRVDTLTLDGTSISFDYDGPYLTRETWSGTVEGEVEREIDAYGELTQLTVLGVATPFQYDADGRLIRAGDLVVRPQLAAAGLSTEHWRRTTTLSRIQTIDRWNQYGEPDEFLYHNILGHSLYWYNVSDRDGMGRERARNEQLVGGGARQYSFEYDTGNRLRRVLLGGAPVAQYTYDSNGNRTRAQFSASWGGRPSVANVIYDAQDRLIQYGETTLGDGLECHYSYSSAGQLTTRNCGAGAEMFEYDLLGNLLSVVLPSGQAIYYDVDPRGRRVRRRVMSGASLLEERRWIYQDSLNPVAELDGSGNLVRVFVYGTRSNVPDYMIDMSSGKRYRFVTDLRGSLHAILDATTYETVQRTEYDPHGVVLSDYVAPGFVRVPFGFAGGLYDPKTGLTRLGARDYDPVTGRWTAKDPIGFAGGDTNLYVYAGGDPVNKIDPEGRALQVVGGFIAGAGANATWQYFTNNGHIDLGEVLIAGAFGAAFAGLAPIMAGKTATETLFGYGMLGAGMGVIQAGVTTPVCEWSTPLFGRAAFFGGLGGALSGVGVRPSARQLSFAEGGLSRVPANIARSLNNSRSTTRSALGGGTTQVVNAVSAWIGGVPSSSEPDSVE